MYVDTELQSKNRFRLYRRLSYITKTHRLSYNNKKHNTRISLYGHPLKLRTGDITLLAKKSGGLDFFARLKAQLDHILSSHFPAHYYFFAEAPDGYASPRWDGNVFGEPPAAFSFFKELYRNTKASNSDKDGQHPYRVSFLNNIDVKTTVYHQMNADMVVTTGSSFPLVALTAYPKVSIL